MKNAIFGDVSCVALVRTNVSGKHITSPILVTLMMEAIYSSETSILTKATWHNIPEDGILRVNNLASQSKFHVKYISHQ
jgi:hypothetical protein